MNLSTLKLSFPLLALGLSACSTVNPPPPAGEPPKVQASPKMQADTPLSTPAPPPVNLDVLRRNLLGADLAFSRVCEEKGIPEGFYQYMSQDAVCLFSGEPPIQGRDAIKIHLAASLQGALSWKPREAEIGSDGDLGYTWGMYEFRAANQDGKPEKTTYGKYVIVWKKHSDGVWKATLYTTSPGPPPSNPR
jgi:ketosteroid isomerase-like protein